MPISDTAVDFPLAGPKSPGRWLWLLLYAAEKNHELRGNNMQSVLGIQPQMVTVCISSIAIL